MQQEDRVIQRYRQLKVGLMAKVMKVTSPRKMFVPMLMMIDTPIAARKRMGSIHDRVDRIRRRMMMGPRMAAALSTWIRTWSCEKAVSADSPVIAWPSPYVSMSSYRALIVGLSLPDSTVTW